MTILCPCCGQTMSERASVDDLSNARLSNQQRRIVNELIRVFPKDVTIEQLADACYWDDIDGGPENSALVLRTVIHKLRKSLPKYGWTIPPNRSGKGNYGRYRLAPIDQEKAA